MNKQTLNDLQSNKNWEKAVVVFTEDSFTEKYSEQSRSYKVDRGDKYFDEGKLGKALIGDCLDGKDNGVRLDVYLGEWEVEYCYILN